MSVNPEGRLGRNTKSQTRIFKHQTPSSKHQKSSKSQAPRRRRRGGIGIWSLGILWCLELGFWSCNSPDPAWKGIQRLAELVHASNRICEKHTNSSATGADRRRRGSVAR